MNTACDGDELLRLLELQWRLEERGEPHLAPDELQEYKRLLGRYDGHSAGGEADSAHPALAPCDARILNDNCLPIPGGGPLICPRSQPKLSSELLPRVEKRCIELGRIGHGETVLWVGCGTSVMTACMWDFGCECFRPAERAERLGSAAGLLVQDVRRILGEPPGSEEFSKALTRALNLIRVLAPLTSSYKSRSGPEFPPRDLALAYVGLSGALDVIRRYLPLEGSSVTELDQKAELFGKLEFAFEAFLAEACGTWPGLAGGAGSSILAAAHCHPPRPPASTKAAASGPLTFEPGAFIYGSHRQPLSGKSLGVLKALGEAEGNVLTLAALRDLCWGDDVIGDEAIRSAVKKARAALRHAIQACDVKCLSPFDPIPIVDRGTGRTAWRLVLP